MNSPVDRYVQYLEKSRKDLLESVKDLTQEELHFTADGKLNSIAMLLNHLSTAEQFLVHHIVGGDEISLERADDFTYHDDTLQDIKTRLHKTRERTLQILSDLADDKLLDAKEVRLSSGSPLNVTNEWGILHNLEHEASHKGQITVLKRLVRS